jgi:hypothetical protein
MSPAPRTYLVECFWPGVDESKLRAAADRAARDRSVVCHELILVLADEIVLGLFQARSETAIADATRRAGLPSERIVESIRIHLGSQDIGAGHDRRRRVVGDVAGPSAEHPPEHTARATPA